MKNLTYGIIAFEEYLSARFHALAAWALSWLILILTSASFLFFDLESLGGLANALSSSYEIIGAVVFSILLINCHLFESVIETTGLMFSPLWWVKSKTRFLIMMRGVMVLLLLLFGLCAYNIQPDILLERFQTNTLTSTLVVIGYVILVITVVLVGRAMSLYNQIFGR